jgi:DNA (cytosine-5)-methyltransferase 1
MPRLLDLFCGAGGAAMGYARAGFEVVGVDIVTQPDYPFEFIQDNALFFLNEHIEELPHAYDVIHASPPCQAFSDMKTMANARKHPDLLAPTRNLLRELGLPYVIENVEGAPMETGPAGFFTEGNGVVLCGSMFGLTTEEYALRRHRLFESNVPLPRMACRHDPSKTVVGFYGDHARIRRRAGGHKDRGLDILGAEKMGLVRDLMGIDWMGWTAANQAIPPAYTEWIGRQLLQAIAVAA